MKNPFNPSFGQKPERFLGREEITREFLHSLDNPNSPWRTTILTGVRGSGKTACLSSIQEALNGKNQIVVSVSPENEFLNDILGQLYRSMPKNILNKLPHIGSISAPGGVKMDLASKDSAPEFTKTFRFQLVTMLDELNKKDIQVVFLIDEVQKHSVQMRTFVATYQHLIREKYGVSMIMAGLPNAISDILNDDVLTFLRRAHRIYLKNVSLILVEMEYSFSFKQAGCQVTQPTIVQAAASTSGYPYLIQLIGYYLWANLENGYDEKDAFDFALANSKAALFQNVHQLVFTELSEQDQNFIFAMSLDVGPSKFADIIERTQKDKNFVSQYRLRLIDNGIIKASGHGLVEFTLPYMKEFLELKRYELG